MRKSCTRCDAEILALADVCWDHLEDRDAWKERALAHVRTHGGHDVSLAGADFSAHDFRGLNMEFVNLSNTDLRGASFAGTDLSRASLTRADARGADFSGARMQVINARRLNAAGADFSTAKLSGATLAHANLSGARLDDAELDGANLRQASLEAASLRGAHLLRTTLSGANLTGADFSGAAMEEVVVIDATGLDTVKSEDGGGDNPLITTDEFEPADGRTRPSELRWKHWKEADESPWEFGRIPPEDENDD